MKEIKYLSILVLALVAFINVSGQNYYHPTAGLQSTYCGACMVSTCSGTYYDNGGNGNYSNNINNIYRTFCPNQAGMCLRATFNTFDIENAGFFGCYDILYVKAGPTQNSPDMWSGCGAGSIGPFTSTDASGCLTFRFSSDGSVTDVGWRVTFSCVPCAYGPNGTDNNDCPNAIPICSNSSFSGSSSGPGIISEGCGGCNISENFTNWYTFTVQSSGTLGLTVDPLQNTNDYDFALYGPGATCSSLGNPIRCSYAANTGNTGMGNGAVDTNEDVNGNGWVSTLNVTAGQTYYLMINKWTPGGNGFNLIWNLTNGASLDCSILSPEITDISSEYLNGPVEVRWSTAEEKNTIEFALERYNGEKWEELTVFDAVGDYSQYAFYDVKPLPGLNRYRVVSVDPDGNFNVSNETSVNVPSSHRFDVYPNPAQNQITIDLMAPHELNSELLITDAMGKVVRKENVSSASNTIWSGTIDVADWATGVYFLHFNGQTNKFVKE